MSAAPFPGTFSSKIIHPLTAQSHPQTTQNDFHLHQQYLASLSYPPNHGPSASSNIPPIPNMPANLALPPNPTYHHLLPYLDSLISQRRPSNHNPSLPPHPNHDPVSHPNSASFNTTAYGNTSYTHPMHAGMMLAEDTHNNPFVNAEASFFGRTPSPANRQRTAQACEKCRERKTKCTGTSPCSRCSSRGLLCSYAPTRPHSNPDREKGPTRNRSEMRNGSVSPMDTSSGYFAQQQRGAGQRSGSASAAGGGNRVDPGPSSSGFDRTAYHQEQIKYHHQYLSIPGPISGWSESAEPEPSSASSTTSRFSISSTTSSANTESSGGSSSADSDVSMPATPTSNPTLCLPLPELLEKKQNNGGGVSSPSASDLARELDRLPSPGELLSLHYTLDGRARDGGLSLTLSPLTDLIKTLPMPMPSPLHLGPGLHSPSAPLFSPDSEVIKSGRGYQRESSPICHFDSSPESFLNLHDESSLSPESFLNLDSSPESNFDFDFDFDHSGASGRNIFEDGFYEDGESERTVLVDREAEKGLERSGGRSQRAEGGGNSNVEMTELVVPSRPLSSLHDLAAPQPRKTSSAFTSTLQLILNPASPSPSPLCSSEKKDAGYFDGYSSLACVDPSPSALLAEFLTEDAIAEEEEEGELEDGELR